MRAFIDAAGHSDGLGMLIDRMPTPLIPIANKPMIHHVIEFLVERDFVEIHFVLSHLPERIETAIGGGERWGARFSFHLARDSDRVFETMRVVCAGWEDEYLLIGRADELPLFDPEVLAEHAKVSGLAAVSCDWEAASAKTGQEGRWSGWAVVPPDRLGSELSGQMHGAISTGAPEGAVERAPVAICSRTGTSVLDSCRTVLVGAFPGLTPAGTESEKGVWIGRNAVIPPSCNVIAPVAIGAKTRLGQNSNIGPGTAVGENCIVERRSLIENSTVFPGSYVGEALEIRHCLVDRNLLINTSVDADVVVSEQFLLGHVSPPGLGGTLWSTIARLAAVLLLILSSPLMLSCFVVLKLARRGGAVFMRRECVRTPTETADSAWKTFHLLSFGMERSLEFTGSAVESFLPAPGLNRLPFLINIASGDMSFVGIAPRSRDELLSLSPDWRQAVLTTKGGAVTLTEKLHGRHSSNDERYVTELFYAATGGWRADLKLLIAALSRHGREQHGEE